MDVSFGYCKYKTIRFGNFFNYSILLYSNHDFSSRAPLTVATSLPPGTLLAAAIGLLPPPVLTTDLWVLLLLAIVLLPSTLLEMPSCMSPGDLLGLAVMTTGRR